MTDRTSKMLATWAPFALALLSLIGGGVAWVAKAQTEKTVQAAVVPVETRITRLETQRESDAERAKRIEDKVDFLVERLVK